MTPHEYRPNPDLPGYCRRCGLVRANRRHDEDAVAEYERLQEYELGLVSAAQAEQRRRIGEAE